MNLSLLLLLASSSLAQFVAQDASRLTVVRSPANSNVTVSYRQPDGACRTAFSSQKQYTGWVNVPGEYPTNLFFWFVEARQRTDSLTIWLNGGPGSSSMYGFFGGNGPCEIVEKGLDQYDTVAREWGWDRSSNMLFIDQVRCRLYLIIHSSHASFTYVRVMQLLVDTLCSLTRSALHTTRHQMALCPSLMVLWSNRQSIQLTSHHHGHSSTAHLVR